MSGGFLLGVMLGFLGMEPTSWFVHRFLFHGVLWPLHVTHHRRGRSPFEWNDLFSLGFAAVAVALILGGTPSPLDSPAAGVGVGMSLFGVLYFLLHDVATHRRFGLGRGWAARLPGPLRRLVVEHRQHHRTADRAGRGPYGFLLPPREPEGHRGRQPTASG